MSQPSSRRGTFGSTGWPFGDSLTRREGGLRGAMFDLVKNIHEGLGIESTWAFVLVVALTLGGTTTLASGVVAWLVDSAYKRAAIKKSDDEHLRARFFVDAPRWYALQNPYNRLEVPIENVGGRSALNFEGKLVIFGQALNTPPIVTDTFSVGNELMPKVPHPYYNNTLAFRGTNIPSQFFVCGIRYEDSQSHEIYRQVFVYKWSGTRNKIGDDRFTEVTIEERRGALNHVQNLIADFQ